MEDESSLDRRAFLLLRAVPKHTMAPTDPKHTQRDTRITLARPRRPVRDGYFSFNKPTSEIGNKKRFKELKGNHFWEQFPASTPGSERVFKHVFMSSFW